MIPGGKEIKIKYILPLVSLDGMLYITDERVYMQPIHPYVLGQSVINIKLSKVRELFKRRYTLMDVGLEIVSYSLNDGENGQQKKSKKKSISIVESAKRSTKNKVICKKRKTKSFKSVVHSIRFSKRIENLKYGLLNNCPADPEEHTGLSLNMHDMQL